MQGVPCNHAQHHKRPSFLAKGITICGCAGLRLAFVHEKMNSGSGQSFFGTAMGLAHAAAKVRPPCSCKGAAGRWLRSSCLFRSFLLSKLSVWRNLRETWKNIFHGRLLPAAPARVHHLFHTAPLRCPCLAQVILYSHRLKTYGVP